MSVNIVINGQGLNFEQEITMAQAGRIINFLGSADVDISQHVGVDNGPQSSLVMLKNETSNLNLKDLIQNHKAKTYAEKIVVTGYFIQQTKNQSNFSSQEIKNELGRLGNSPTQFGRELNKAEKEMQYLYCEDKKEEIYSITEAGKEAMENNFSDIDGKKSFTKRKNGGQAKQPKINVREEIINAQISTVMEGFPNYHDLKTKWEKIIWIILFADNSNLGALTAAEVEALSSKLRGKIAQTGFAAHNKANITKGFVVSQPGGKYSIEQTGINYLRGLIKTEGGK